MYLNTLAAVAAGDVADAVTGGLSGLGGELTTIAAFGIGIGATVLALRVGWRTIKKFVS